MLYRYLINFSRYLNVKQAGTDNLSEKCRKWPKIHCDIDSIIINLVSFESLLNSASVLCCSNPFPKRFLKKPDHNLVGLVGVELFWLCSLNECTKTGNCHA